MHFLLINLAAVFKQDDNAGLVLLAFKGSSAQGHCYWVPDGVIVWQFVFRPRNARDILLGQPTPLEGTLPVCSRSSQHRGSKIRRSLTANITLTVPAQDLSCQGDDRSDLATPRSRERGYFPLPTQLARVFQSGSS